MYWQWVGFSAVLLGCVLAEPCILREGPANKPRDLEDVSRIFEDGPLTVSWKNQTSPSVTTTEYMMDLCAPLPRKKDAQSEDECPNDTLICKKVINEKHGDSRVIEVVPLATRTESFHDQSGPLSRSTNVKGFYDVSLKGPVHDGVEQRVLVSVRCDEQSIEPQLKVTALGEQSNGMTRLEIKTAHSCHRAPLGHGLFSGFARFLHFVFWLAVAGSVLYLLGGIWQNYTYYGARGWDLVPNRDFWREIPFMIQDRLHRTMRTPSRANAPAGYDPL